MLQQLERIVNSQMIAEIGRDHSHARQHDHHANDSQPQKWPRDPEHRSRREEIVAVPDGNHS